MSKPLAGFYGQRSVKHSQQPMPQEYTVLGVNQPLIAPQAEPVEHLLTAPGIAQGQQKFRLSLFLNKLM